MNDFISSYFSRIGLIEHIAPTVSIDTLKKLCIQHSTNIPFENIDVLLKRDIRLDVLSLEEKLVNAHRGGYCYEQNGLLELILSDIGFTVRSLLGRVLLSEPKAPPPRTHRLLLVELKNQNWIVDIGFGGNTPTAPILLQPGILQETPHNIYRFIYDNNNWTLQINLHDNWQSMYQFDLSHQYESDHFMANFLMAHWEKSHFLDGLLMSRHLADGGKITLSNFAFTHRSKDQIIQKAELPNVSKLYEVIETRFGLGVNDERHGFSEEELSSIMHNIIDKKSNNQSIQS
ncbi:arylamine N-acetyltransferase [Serratia ureilytica]|uniref:arylamine N-acetyltransferase n=1 Tax=Serratia ureilytica TaxID=300181 RepID=UPI0018D70DEC|nr:arylamine N-acetyltransferase [Serratia ureilytica]MBH3156863.1 arylamine N-acetyltransferase [Serratia ureilytica]MBH3251975.1 arylamine N-acetyltransferase [Serratia ureilytica]